MSIEPLNTYTLVHKLNFINDDFGIVEIDEPFQFDGANFVVEQEKGRYGRDVSFAGEEISFKFVNQQNIKGHQFAKLVEYYKRYGFESRVQYILSENNEDYVVGVLDFKTAETDLFSYFDCKVIQDTSQAILRRRKETKIDLFSDTDVKGNPITPVSTSRILFKSKPVIQNSSWTTKQYVYDSQFFGLQATARFPLFQVQGDYGIKDSYISFYDVYDIPLGSTTITDFYRQSREELQHIKARTELSDITLKIRDLSLSCNFGGIATVTKSLVVIWGSGYEVGQFEGVTLEETNNDSINIFNQNYDVDIPYVPAGGFIGVIFTIHDNYTISTTVPSSSGGLVLEQGATLEIEAKSTHVDTVTDGVRLKDANNQIIKSINQDFNVTQPRFDVGGEWYNNFIFSGNMIRGLNKPFVTSLKESLEQLKEFNCDYQINGTNIEIVKYDDFYVDEEIASFLLAPDETFKSSYNDKYELNQFDFKYKNFNQDKDDENTDDAVHTETENIIQNDQVETIKTIDLPYVRDPFLGESTKRKGIETKPTTSLSQDDKVFIYDVEPMPINPTKIYRDSLTHNVILDYGAPYQTAELQLVNSGNFDWTVLGFEVGSEFIIEDTVNANTYTVLEITQTSILLDSVGGAQMYNLVDVVTTIEYPLVGVEYQIRTNEGFEAIENVLAPFEYPNLYYTPKNNILNNWLPYLSTARKYNNDDITVSYFKNGGNLLTRLVGGEDVIENAPITDLDNAILDPIILTSKVIANFSQFRDLESKLKTIKGYVTIRDNKGQKRKVHPSRLEFLWSENILNITGELRKESLIMNIVRDDDVIKLMRDGYDDIEVYELNYDVLYGYLEFLNENYVSLTERIKYDLITVDSVSYNNEYDLIAAIQAL